MKSQKGQALIEFILVLPVFFLIVTSFIDFGTILYEKYKMNQILDTATNIFLSQGEDATRQYVSKEKVNFDFKKQDDIYKLSIIKSKNILTPGLNKVLGNPYQIEETKYVYPLTVNENNLNNNEGVIDES